MMTGSHATPSVAAHARLRRMAHAPFGRTGRMRPVSTACMHAVAGGRVRPPAQHQRLQRHAREWVSGSAPEVRQLLAQRYHLGEQVSVLGHALQHLGGLEHEQLWISLLARGPQLAPVHGRGDRRAGQRPGRVDARRSSCARRSGSSRSAPCRARSALAISDAHELRAALLEQVRRRRGQTAWSARRSRRRR